MSDESRPGSVQPDHDGFVALQQLVAARHHVLLGRDDPIAMLQTVNELLVQHTAAALERAQLVALAKFGHELELSASTTRREAKELIERSLEAARRVSAEQIDQATQDFLAVLARERECTRKTVQRASTLNMLVLLALALGVVGALWLH